MRILEKYGCDCARVTLRASEIMLESQKVNLWRHDQHRSRHDGGEFEKSSPVFLHFYFFVHFLSALFTVFSSRGLLIVQSGPCAFKIGLFGRHMGGLGCLGHFFMLGVAWLLHTNDEYPDRPMESVIRQNLEKPTEYRWTAHSCPSLPPE